MTTKHKNHHHYDLYDDVEKIKAALIDTASDIKGKAGEMFTQSIDDVKERSESIKDGLIDYTIHKPFKTLGMTLLIGVGIGYFLRK